MKKHLHLLFDPERRWLTTALFAAALLLISASQAVGITDNLPGIAMLLAGIICLFFTLLHPWRKVEYYALLIGACVAVILLGWLGINVLVKLNKTEYISETVVMVVVFCICVPGILTGIIGTLICAFRKN
jgi:hypothetical protein